MVVMSWMCLLLHAEYHLCMHNVEEEKYSVNVQECIRSDKRLGIVGPMYEWDGRYEQGSDKNAIEQGKLKLQSICLQLNSAGDVERINPITGSSYDYGKTGLSSADARTGISPTSGHENVNKMWYFHCYGRHGSFSRVRNITFDRTVPFRTWRNFMTAASQVTIFLSIPQRDDGASVSRQFLNWKNTLTDSLSRPHWTFYSLWTNGCGNCRWSIRTALSRRQWRIKRIVKACCPYCYLSGEHNTREWRGEAALCQDSDDETSFVRFHESADVCVYNGWEWIFWYKRKVSAGARVKGTGFSNRVLWKDDVRHMFLTVIGCERSLKGNSNLASFRRG